MNNEPIPEERAGTEATEARNWREGLNELWEEAMQELREENKLLKAQLAAQPSVQETAEEAFKRGQLLMQVNLVKMDSPYGSLVERSKIADYVLFDYHAPSITAERGSK